MFVVTISKIESKDYSCEKDGGDFKTVWSFIKFYALYRDVKTIFKAL